VFSEQVAVAFVGSGRKEFKRDDRAFRQGFGCLDIANELHVMREVR